MLKDCEEVCFSENTWILEHTISVPMATVYAENEVYKGAVLPIYSLRTKQAVIHIVNKATDLPGNP